MISISPLILTFIYETISGPNFFPAAQVTSRSKCLKQSKGQCKSSKAIISWKAQANNKLSPGEIVYLYGYALPMDIEYYTVELTMDLAEGSIS